MFVSEYAALALARIDGKAPVSPDHRKAVAGDLNLLPGEASVVGQCVGLSQKSLTVETMADVMIAQSQQPAQRGMFQQKLPGKDAIVQRVVGKILEVAERIGNVRLDGITFAVSADAGPRSGSAVVIFRGEYDREALMEAFKAWTPAERGGDLNITEEGTVKVLREADQTLLMPSNELVAIVVADKEPDRAAAKTALLAAIKTGKGTLGDDKLTGALLKRVDMQSPLWIVARLNDSMRKESVFGGFETIMLATKMEKDAVSFTFSGHGSDAEKVKGAVETLNTGIANSLAQLQAMAGQIKSMQPMLEVMQSLKVQSNAADATMTGQLKDTIVDAIVGEVGPMIVMEMETPAATRP